MTHVLPGLLVPGHVGEVLAVVPPHSPHPAGGHSSSLLDLITKIIKSLGSENFHVPEHDTLILRS
jgi:hypothetical protein